MSAGTVTSPPPPAMASTKPPPRPLPPHSDAASRWETSVTREARRRRRSDRSANVAFGTSNATRAASGSPRKPRHRRAPRCSRCAGRAHARARRTCSSARSDAGPSPARRTRRGSARYAPPSDAEPAHEADFVRVGLGVEVADEHRADKCYARRVRRDEAREHCTWCWRIVALVELPVEVGREERNLPDGRVDLGEHEAAVLVGAGQTERERARDGPARKHRVSHRVGRRVGRATERDVIAEASAIALA